MSVIAARRKESKFEPIIFADELHSMLREFSQRNFAAKADFSLPRRRFEYSAERGLVFWDSRYLLHTHKVTIDRIASTLTSNLRAANSIYPTSMNEYRLRRKYQTQAVANCEQLIKELQTIGDDFNVDINAFKRYVEAIDREINLIKKWRQRDNKIKVSLMYEGNV